MVKAHPAGRLAPLIRQCLAALAIASLGAPITAAEHVDESKIRYVLPPDAIPAITQPKFDEGRWLRDSDKVIGFAHAGEARAYPLRILVWHEIVDDEVGGAAVAVTYCPLCGTGIVFNRTVGNVDLVLKVSGRLYMNDLVMYDAQTGSLWAQVLGQAIKGPLHGRNLEPLGSTLATWKEWRLVHPATRVLSRETGHDRDYNQDPYQGYDRDREIGIFGETRDDVRGIHPKEFVLGYAGYRSSIAFRYSRLAETGLAQARLEGRDLVATFAQGSAHLFSSGGHTFSPGPDGRLVDERGTRWDPRNGTSEQGDSLEALAGIPSFWFAWLDFHPDTVVWGAFGIESITPRRGARAVDDVTPVVVEFTSAVDAGQRENITSLLRVSPDTPVQLRWQGDRQLVVTPSPRWPTGRISLSFDPSLKDGNGTALEVETSSFFTVGGLDVPAPEWLVSVGVVGLAVIGFVTGWRPFLQTQVKNREGRKGDGSSVAGAGTERAAKAQRPPRRR